MSDLVLEIAIRRALRKRGKIKRIARAIHAAAAEAHITGRVEPFPDGIPPIKSIEAMVRYKRAAIQALEAK
jgi:hypothetical protein